MNKSEETLVQVLASKTKPQVLTLATHTWKGKQSKTDLNM